ncbi:MAG: DUF1997 domain-containing protein [Microcystaceae cyanobacterium]
MSDLAQEQPELQPIHFQSAFDGSMEMYSDLETVADYLQHHQGWFSRCAQPMKAEPLGEHGYVLIIGKFGALGFDVEPKMAVILEPPQDGRYLMHTVPLPDEPFLGYEVDYQAVMVLAEIPRSQAGEGLEKVYRKQGLNELPESIVKVQWQLRMDVAVSFPKYIYKLSLPLIQRTGDRLLAEIIRQVSPRLTYKVQKDFHNRFSLPLPPKSGRAFYRVSLSDKEEIAENEQD